MAGGGEGQELLAERAEALRHERDLASARTRELADQSDAAMRHERAARAQEVAEWEAERKRLERLQYLLARAACSRAMTTALRTARADY